MKYHVIVFGCQMNISDAERVSAVLESIKYKNTQDIDEADLIVVTMCSVRQSAVDRIHGLVEKFKKLKKKPTTILTGCVLKRDRKKFFEGFDYVIDIKEIRFFRAHFARQRGLAQSSARHVASRRPCCRACGSPSKPISSLQ